MSSIVTWAGAAALVLAAIQLQPPAQAGQQPAGTSSQQAASGRIAGRVTAADGGPLARARVTIASDVLAAPRVVLTDSQGRFTFDGLPTGRYTATARRSLYVSQAFGGSSPTAVDLTDGQQLTAIDFVLQPAGVISGRILDEDGSPLAGAVLSALHGAMQGGQRTWAPIATTTSDDRGEFGLFGIPGGSYLVSAIDPAFQQAATQSGASACAPTYFPGVVSPEQARQVTVDPQRAPERLEFTLHLVPPVRVSGHLTAWNTQALRSAAVIISPHTGQWPSAPAGEARMTPDGSFTFTDVGPGQYVIRAHGETDPEGPSLFATFAVVVEGRDIGHLELVLMPGGMMEGRVAAKARHGYPAPVLQGLRLRAPLADGTSFGDTLSGTMAQNGDFRLTGIIAGSHALTVEGVSFPWRIEEAIVQGRDLTSTAFDVERQQQFRRAQILLTDTAAGVSGTVAMPPQVTAADVLVVAFPANALKRRLPVHFVRRGRPSAENAYRFADLTPGDYLVAAVIGIGEDEVRDPALLDRLAEIASPITLPEARIVSLPLVARPLSSRVPSS